MADTFYSTDVVIIGAGPVGLFAIFECGMMRMKCHVVDTLDMIGGQCSALYPEKPIYDIPAHPKISAQTLIDNLYEQAAPFDPVYHLGTQVVSLEPSPFQGWRVGLSNHRIIETKAVIVAAGVGAFGPHKPPLDNIDAFENKSIFYYVKKREDFRGKRIVIAGGGDSAVDWALSLLEIAEKIMIVHRRPKFRAAPEAEAKLHALAHQGKIDLIIPYQLDALEGNKGFLETVIVKTMEGKEQRLKADCLLPFFGLSMNLGPIAQWGLNLEKNHIVVDPATCETSSKGIFAIGDIAHYSHKLKLILCGFSEAAHAARAARDLVFPDEVWHFEYSTTQGITKIA